MHCSKEYSKGKYHCTIDLLFDWFGISCMTTDSFFAKQTNPNLISTVILPSLVFPIIHFVRSALFFFIIEIRQPLAEGAEV
jgi:hypothetical protein